MIGARFHDLAGRSAYQVLDVPETAGPEDLNRGYRRRMRDLHPDRGGDQAEAQLVSTAHRWLIRHREDYDRFLRDQRKVDPGWGRAASPGGAGADSGGTKSNGTSAEGDSPPGERRWGRSGAATGSLRMPDGAATGSFRTQAQERMAGRAAEWAERQRRERWEGPAEARLDEAAQAAAAARRAEWASDGGDARTSWDADLGAEERGVWEATRLQVARRREERLRADAERGGADPKQSSGSGEEQFAGTGFGGERSGTEQEPSASDAAGSEATRGQAEETWGETAPERSEAGPAEPGVDEREPKAFAQEPVPPVRGPQARTGRPASIRKSRRRRKLRLPRLGLPPLPRLGIPAAPRVGIPALPRLGFPRLGLRVMPRRRSGSGVSVEAVVLAVLILVLGFLVALRVPF